MPLFVRKNSANLLHAFTLDSNGKTRRVSQTQPLTWGTVATDPGFGPFDTVTAVFNQSGSLEGFGRLRGGGVVAFINGQQQPIAVNTATVPTEMSAALNPAGLVEMVLAGSPSGMVVLRESSANSSLPAVLQNVASAGTLSDLTLISTPLLTTEAYAISRGTNQVLRSVQTSTVLPGPQIVSGNYGSFSQVGSATNATAIAVNRNSNNMVDVVMIGTPNGRALGVYHARQTASGFADWNLIAGFPFGLSASSNLSLGRVLGGPVAGAKLTVFVDDGNGNIATAQQMGPDSTGWNAWLRLPTSPAPLTRVGVDGSSTSLVDVVATDSSAVLFHSQQTASGFSAWARIG